MHVSARCNVPAETYRSPITIQLFFICRIKAFSKLSDPWVRLVDPIVGEQVGMRVDVDLSDGTTACGLFVHKRLSDSVG